MIGMAALTTILCLTDAVVGFEQEIYRVMEEAGSIDICVDSGVTDGFQADLIVDLVANDSKASEYNSQMALKIYFILRYSLYSCTRRY